MVANPGKFQAIIINGKNKSNNKSILRINNKHNIVALFNAKMSKKAEKVQERCLRLLLNEHTKNFLQLIEITEKPTMRKKRLCVRIEPGFYGRSFSYFFQFNF